MMSEIELDLIRKAESDNDEVANEAMRVLRASYDSTYGWCADCDYLVCKEKDCCLNQHPSELSDEEINTLLGTSKCVKCGGEPFGSFSMCHSCLDQGSGHSGGGNF